MATMPRSRMEGVPSGGHALEDLELADLTADAQQSLLAALREILSHGGAHDQTVEARDHHLSGSDGCRYFEDANISTEFSFWRDIIADQECSSHARLNVSRMTLSTLNRCDNSISRVQELFDKFDANHDGSIGSDEMIGAILDQGLEIGNRTALGKEIISYLGGIIGEEIQSIDLPTFGLVFTQLRLAELFTPYEGQVRFVKTASSQGVMRLQTIEYNSTASHVDSPLELGKNENDENVKRFFFSSMGHFLPSGVKWMHFDASKGLDRLTLLRLGVKFRLHPIVINEIIDPRTPPRMDRYTAHCVISMDVATLASDATSHPRVHVDRSSMTIILMNHCRTVITILQDEPDETSWMALWKESNKVSNTEEEVLQSSSSRRSKPRRSITEQVLKSMTMTLSSNPFREPGMTAIWTQLQKDTEASPPHHLREHSGDYLVYEMLARIVAELRPITDGYARRLGHFHSEGMSKFSEQWLRELAEVRFELKELTRSVRPTGRVVKRVIADPLFSNKVKIYFEDLSNTIEEFLLDFHQLEEMAATLVQSHGEYREGRMNATLYVLSVVSAIFLPLSFVTGLFGMNFENMPELNWSRGYMYFWILEGLIVVIVALFLLILRMFAGKGNIYDHVKDKVFDLVNKPRCWRKSLRRDDEDGEP
eukprot:CAMPEP_0194543780 /NCGR_PEP_ID=MMETSP0253-20130528/86397_1 /TAXON_ID=2966 /ORGANISM="Noctiluca scintillans" /LENGTH=651 /DNA_ID=CAMNT_0039390581 /DNA_START=125 /DNA_END=2080 /DNA_ORIENTATION=-